MDKYDLRKTLEKMGYCVNNNTGTGTIEARTDDGWHYTNLKVDSHDDHGFGYRYFDWLPISYVVWCIEHHTSNLGEHTKYDNKFYPCFSDKGITPGCNKWWGLKRW